MMIRPQQSASAQRVVIEYSYHQHGSTKRWERGKAEFRSAAQVEHSKPLGPRLAENNAKIVWIEVHAEIEPGEHPVDVADRYESAADAEFRKHRPGHTIA
jgi:hypothetical protein